MISSFKSSTTENIILGNIHVIGFRENSKKLIKPYVLVDIIMPENEKEKNQIAKKLKKDNVPIQKIIKYTGLSLSVIQKL